MGRRGPKKTPTLILEQRGSFEKNPQRRRTREPEAPAGTFAPPMPLDGEAKAHWDRLAATVRSLGLESPVYSASLQMLAEALADYYRCRAVVRKDGFTLTVATQFGERVVRHPAAIEMNACWQRVMKLTAEFGLTPAAKAGVAADVPTDDEIEKQFFNVIGD